MPKCVECSTPIPLIPYLFGKKKCETCREKERGRVKEMLGDIFQGPIVKCPECGRNLGRPNEIRGTPVVGGIALSTVCPYCMKEIYLRR